MMTETNLRTMLTTVLEQNRKLVLQNKRFQQVWFGMNQMCKALAMPTCDCSEPTTNASSIEETTTQSNNRPTQANLTYESKLRILSMKSSGLNSNSTTLTFVYAATPNHTTDWIGPRKNGGQWRTSGRRSQSEPESQVYTSTADIKHPQSIRTMFFRIFSEDDGAVIKINLTEAEIPQEQNITRSASLLQVNTTYNVPIDSDLNITVIVFKNVNNFSEFDDVEAHISGLNSSTSPATVFEISNYFSDEINLSKSRRTNTTTTMTISLARSCVKYGGILSIRVPYSETMTGMIEQLSYGPNIKIYAPETKEIVPYNSLAFYPVASDTTVFPPSDSLACAAIGNPQPNVTILKIVNDEKIEELEAETVINDGFMHVKTLHLSAKQPHKTEGRYVCRATNGVQVIEAPTKVTVLDPAVFVEEKTGLTKNTSDVIIISCKAKGKPRPHISLRLYDEYGPDLLLSRRHRQTKSAPNKNSSRVTLTISPTDAVDIHTVFCLSIQGGPSGSYRRYKKIEVYPGVEKGKNWALYSRLRKSQAFRKR